METYQIISSVCIVVGIIAFFFLMRPRKYRDPSAADQYTKVRNKLTVREEKKPEKPEETEEDGSPFSFFGNIIGGFVVILIGVSLIGPIANVVNDINNNTNNNNTNQTCVANAFGECLPWSSISSTMLKMVPAFFGLSVIAVALAIVASALRNAQII